MSVHQSPQRFGPVENGPKGTSWLTDHELNGTEALFPAASVPVLWSYLTPVESEVQIGSFCRPKQRYSVGDFRLVRPGQNVRRAPSTPAVIRAVSLPLEAFSEHIDVLDKDAQNALHHLERETFRSNAVDVLTQSLANAQTQEAPAFLVESLAHAILLEVWRFTSQTTCGAQKCAHGGLTPAKRAQLDQFIHDTMEHKISLEALADVAGMPVFSFSRAFKKAMGVSPYKHVMNLRIAEARTMIATGHLSLSEIAYRCGFSSQSHMTDVFRARVGTSPGQLRKG